MSGLLASLHGLNGLVAERSVDLHGEHLTTTEAYVIVAVLAFFAVLSLIRKLIVLAAVAALIAVAVIAYHNGAFS